MCRKHAYAQKPNLGGVESWIGEDLTHPGWCHGGVLVVQIVSCRNGQVSYVP